MHAGGNGGTPKPIRLPGHNRPAGSKVGPPGPGMARACVERASCTFSTARDTHGNTNSPGPPRRPGTCTHGGGQSRGMPESTAGPPPTRPRMGNAWGDGHLAPATTWTSRGRQPRSTMALPPVRHGGVSRGEWLGSFAGAKGQTALPSHAILEQGWHPGERQPPRSGDRHRRQRAGSRKPSRSAAGQSRRRKRGKSNGGAPTGSSRPSATKG